MAEDTKNELVPVADYEVLDQVDDQAIVEMMTGKPFKIMSTRLSRVERWLKD